MALERIDVSFENCDVLPEERETWQVGEAVNAQLGNFLRAGLAQGALREDLEIIPTILLFWGMISGLIQLAASKEPYIAQAAGLSQEQFLERGFRMLYRSIARKREVTA